MLSSSGLTVVLAAWFLCRSDAAWPALYWREFPLDKCPDDVVDNGEKYLNEHASLMGANAPFALAGCRAEDDDGFLKVSLHFLDNGGKEFEVRSKPVSENGGKEIQTSVALKDVDKNAAAAASMHLNVSACLELRKSFSVKDPYIVWNFRLCGDGGDGFMKIDVNETNHAIVKKLRPDTLDPPLEPLHDSCGRMTEPVPGAVVAKAWAHLNTGSFNVTYVGPFDYLDTYIDLPDKTSKLSLTAPASHPSWFMWDVRFRDSRNELLKVKLRLSGLSVEDQCDASGKCDTVGAVESVNCDRTITCGALKEHYRSMECCSKPEKMVPRP